MTIFLRLLSSSNKEQSLLSACTSQRASVPDIHVFDVPSLSFGAIPGTPFAYWAPRSIVSIFSNFAPAESASRRFTKGLCTTDDFRFVRLWWEPNISFCDGDNKKWFSFANGSKSQQFYCDQHLSLNWHTDGRELKSYLNHKIGKPNQWSRWINSVEYYFKPGVTWPLRSSKFSPQVLPAGTIFSIRSYAGFEETGDGLCMLAILASSIFDYLFKISLGRFGFPEFVIGVIQKLPYPIIQPKDRVPLERLVRRAWGLRRSLASTEETSHAFLLPARLQGRLATYNTHKIEVELRRIQAEIDAIAFALYDLSNADRITVQESNKVSADEIRIEANNSSSTDDKEGEDEDKNEYEDEDDITPIDQTTGLLSWAGGIAFGHFDWRLATGERAAPTEPNPFDPLPSKSPGMLPDGDEPFHLHDGILVDDPGHKHDLAQLIEEILTRVDTAIPPDVRRWLQREFFPFHLQRYSKSRRKAPVYWPLATASGGYTLWLYYPNLNSQTLYTAVNEFVEPKLEHLGKELAALRNKGSARSRDDDKTMETLQTLEKELVELGDTLLQVAPTYRPNHDDGVQIAAAPLWPLFRHKPWQKVLKETWEKLNKGDYDWSHLAMAYWPDRVREKCKTDKSLAIAHGLEELYEPPPESATGPGRGGRKRRGAAL